MSTASQNKILSKIPRACQQGLVDGLSIQKLTHTHTHINASPPPDTSGMCGTYSVVESDTGTTTLFSADPLCIPDRVGKTEK